MKSYRRGSTAAVQALIVAHCYHISLLLGSSSVAVVSAAFSFSVPTPPSSSWRTSPSSLVGGGSRAVGLFLAGDNDGDQQQQQQQQSGKENENAYDNTLAGGEKGIRLNKVFRETHSRRQADALIADPTGRVTVNGCPVAVTNAGMRVSVDDVVRLDGDVVDNWWAKVDDGVERQPPRFDYIKYWKPLGVVCTTDRRIPDNILDALEQRGSSGQQRGQRGSQPQQQQELQLLPKGRIFPVGRLDRDTSGIILLTSDGRLPNLVLRGDRKKPKTYRVQVQEPRILEEAIRRLRNGVVITTQAQRDRRRPPPLTAPTKPCEVCRISGNDSDNELEITIVEGRNRQIRKMLAAVGHTVTRLHRSQFMDLTLEGLDGPGQWKRLSAEEQAAVDRVLEEAQVN